MSSINHRPTFHYSQPEAYRFSHDSVFLAQQVFDLERENLQPDTKILDLCAGCGIIGMDFLFHSRNELGFSPPCDFLEMQDDYIPHFEENVRRLNANPDQMQFLKQNYADLLNGPSHRYNLVLCNPPYFRIGQGPLSPSEFKNRCRFYLDSDFKTLLRATVHVLKPEGSAYFLFRNLSDHSVDILAEARAILEGHAALEVIGDIRGTSLVRVKHTR